MSSSGQTVIAAMVKSRECCRRLVQSYEQARALPPASADEHVGRLRSADRAASLLLHYIRMLPRELGIMLSARNDRAYATRLRAEIRELLERAVILERETRQGLSSAQACHDGGPRYD